MKSLDIRKKFFDFFVKHGHEHVKSSSLIPAQDPTLLFANAGMNQFKDLFLGTEKRKYNKATTIQKCVRAGGKHNDLDNVGFTKRHLTFFEMMGNFSFGDYFKKEAIRFAWDFLTKEVGLPIEKLHASVHHTDQDSYNIWLNDIGLPKEQIHKLGDADNFWQMGETGPCGPCSEIHLDRGPEYGNGKMGQKAAGDRYLEIWNLVFMQYDKQPDGTNKPLTQTGVDTGMGLERLCVVLQNKDSVFETDLFEQILSSISQLTGTDYAKQDAQTKAAFHVLADHVRSASLLIADGCAPSNDGRGYVLRKIIRRAALFAQKLTDTNIFPQLAKVFIESMQDIYPELAENKILIGQILTSEIEKFATNLIRGKNLLDRYFEANKTKKIVSGEQAFKLYDTYGFPIELIHIMAGENGFTVDSAGFKKFMAKQKEQSGKKTTDSLSNLDLGLTTTFTGYQELQTSGKIIGLVVDEEQVESVKANIECYVITNKSPFFIVGGGQVPDYGWLQFEDTNKIKHTEVRYIGNAIACKIKAPVELSVGSSVTSIVHKQRRIDAMKNHTGTHLLQAALIELFGKQIKQSGSLVHPDYLRFDFTYHTNLSPEDIIKVENLVNQKIRQNIPVTIEHTTLKEATDRGVIAFFGDKYKPEKVRIVQVGEFSAELCGGTHVNATGDIGLIKITEVSALSAGHRRIVAVTGAGAMRLFQATFATTKKLCQNFKIKKENILETIEKQQALVKNLQTQIKKFKKLAWQAQLPQWVKKIQPVNGIPFLFITLQNMANDELKSIANQLQSKQPGFYVLISKAEKKTIVFAQLAPQHKSTLNLKKFGAWLKEHHNIHSGGSPLLLQGGAGKIDGNLEQAITQWITQSGK